MDAKPDHNIIGQAEEPLTRPAIRIAGLKRPIGRLHYINLIPIHCPSDRAPVQRRNDRNNNPAVKPDVTARDHASTPPVVPPLAAPLSFIEQRIPVGLLGIDSVRFQFKGDSDSDGIVPGERLAGEYIELGTGRLIVWQDLALAYWVSDGHHRLDLAKRVGKEDLPVYLLRAVDGWTVERAIAAAAHANILIGTGKMEDYVRYFRTAPITEREAEASGLLGRKKGRDAWAIGKQAGEGLYSFYLNQNDPKSQEVAVAIARAAPNDDRLQQMGLEYFDSDEVTALEVSEYIGVTRHWGTRSVAVQMGLFGPNLEAEHKAMAEAAAGIITEHHRHQQDLKQALKRQGRLELTEAEAQGYGITDRNDIGQLKAALERVTRDLYEWERWRTDSDKTHEVLQRAGLIPPVTAS